VILVLCPRHVMLLLLVLLLLLLQTSRETEPLLSASRTQQLMVATSIWPHAKETEVPSYGPPVPSNTDAFSTRGHSSNCPKHDRMTRKMYYTTMRGYNPPTANYTSLTIILLLFSTLGNVFGVFVRGLILVSYNTHSHILRATISHVFSISPEEFPMLERRLRSHA
jgi:hypothetical protein